ncbi:MULTISPECIES: polysaccharide deacetylase family protein [Haloferax]|uniref:polysaccharide deacetylase family protein n=1 Tax=Haloferax TaxID=2251 RepID=UPI001CD9FFDD|nr:MULTISPECIES: polysaccharide deacetylase family protein [Haloferax]
MSDFALCLTHDVDRPYKTYQSLFYATKERPAYHLRTLLSRKNPYWQFEDIMALERDLGVRSSFYFLNEPSLFRTGSVRDLLDPKNVIEHAGRYDITADPLVDVILDLDAGGWEVGIHGSFRSSDDIDRLWTEKQALESILGHEILGGRQHHLKLTDQTWEYHREIGLAYDASPGSSSEFGFQHGYQPFRPFDDEFVVFPLTLMEVALPDPGVSFDDAWAACERLLVEAEANDAVMTVLWHPRYFSEAEFPGYRRLYRRLIEWALERDAWVGPVSEYYREFLKEMPAGRDETAIVSARETESPPSSRPNGPTTRETGYRMRPERGESDESSKRSFTN